MSTIDQQFLEYIVKSLVGKPEAVKIDRSIDEKGVFLELTVDPEDLGRIIGKRGATATSIRSLLRALGTKNDARYNLKIIDNGRPPENNTSYSRPEEPVANDTPSENTDDYKSEQAPEAIEPTEEVQEKPDQNSVVNKTRKELEELDDLDI